MLCKLQVMGMQIQNPANYWRQKVFRKLEWNKKKPQKYECYLITRTELSITEWTKTEVKQKQFLFVKTSWQKTG